MFTDRTQAGDRLADALAQYDGVEHTIVLGIPRGGVVVAHRVARGLGLPLDVAVAAKVGAPGNPEYAIGAVAQDGEVTVNPTAGFSAEDVKRYSSAARAKVERYASQLRGDRPPLDVRGMTVLLVDDGLATGLTARAAVAWLKRQRAARVVVAVPVASASAVEDLEREAGEVVALSIPTGFYAVGQFYESFGQTEDEEVERLLEDSRTREVAR